MDGFDVNIPRVFDHFLEGHPIPSGFIASGSLAGPRWQVTQSVLSSPQFQALSGDAGAGGVARLTIASGNQNQAFVTLKDDVAPYFLNSGGTVKLRALIRPATTVSGVHGYALGMAGPGGGIASGLLNSNQSNVLSGHTCGGLMNVSGSLFWSVFGANASGSSAVNFGAKTITETTVPVDSPNFRDVLLTYTPMGNGLVAVQGEIDGKQLVDNQGRMIRTWITNSGQALTPFLGLVDGSASSIAQFDIDAIDVKGDTHQR